MSNFRNQRGFTLIQFLVVMGVLAFIFALMFSRLQGGDNVRTLSAKAESASRYFEQRLRYNEDDIDQLVANYFSGNSIINSPWDKNKPLFILGGSIKEVDKCDALAQSNPGQIVICYAPSKKAVYLTAVDPGQKTYLFQKVVF